MMRAMWWSKWPAYVEGIYILLCHKVEFSQAQELLKLQL